MGKTSLYASWCLKDPADIQGVGASAWPQRQQQASAQAQWVVMYDSAGYVQIMSSLQAQVHWHSDLKVLLNDKLTLFNTFGFLAAQKPPLPGITSTA